MTFICVKRIYFMSSSNVIIPSCHYGPVSPCAPNSIWSPHLWKPDWRTPSPGTAKEEERRRRRVRRKVPLLYRGNGRQESALRKSLQINIGNVSFNRNAASFVERYILPRWSELTDLNICASPPLWCLKMFILFICPLSKWRGASWETVCEKERKGHSQNLNETHWRHKSTLLNSFHLIF